MEYKIKGKIIQGVGGLYTVADLCELESEGDGGQISLPQALECRARGVSDTTE